MELLRGTCEYADMDDNDIIKAANSLKSKLAQPKGGKGSSVKSTGQRSSKSLKSVQAQKNNDWIPTEAVRAILKIQEEFGEPKSETCVSQILYELNTIWRNIMRKENEAIKKKLTAQI